MVGIRAILMPEAIRSMETSPALLMASPAWAKPRSVDRIPRIRAICPISRTQAGAFHTAINKKTRTMVKSPIKRGPPSTKKRNILLLF